MTKAQPPKKKKAAGPVVAGPTKALAKPSSARAGRPLAPIPTPGLDPAQLTKAAAALAKHARAAAGQGLFADDDELVYLIISLKKTPVDNRNDKPVRLPIPHPIYRFEGAEVCLFVKDDPAPTPGAPRTHSAAKARAKAAGVLAKGGAGVGVSKIIGLSKLKQKYEPHEAKRALCRAFDLFLADSRVLPMLPRALGKSFFTAKKQPVPVELRGGPGRDWAAEVRRALDATYLHRGGGTCVNIRVGRTSQDPAEVAANAGAALAGALPHLVRGWSGVRSVLLKLAGSAALPVYQSLEAAEVEEETDVAAVEAGGGGAVKAVAAAAAAGKKKKTAAKQLTAA